MTFRSRRGEGIQRLMAMQKRNEGFGEDNDDFWRENKYFGRIGYSMQKNTQASLQAEEEDDEDFDAAQFKDVKDVFDSDFQDTSDLAENDDDDDEDHGSSGSEDNEDGRGRKKHHHNKQ